MHFYSFNIGDYISHTRHLTPLEDIAYRRLLDTYYLNERPLNGSPTELARTINMRQNEAEVESVLVEFFVQQDGAGWVNLRADEEIQKYKAKLEVASRAGKASAERRFNDRSTTVQPNKKQETINTKQETIRLKTKTTELIIKPDDVSVSTWQDFLQIRKAKKAPLTASAIKGIEREAAKAGWTLGQAMTECCLRGWAGFKADWVKTDSEKKMTSTQTQNLAAARTIFGDERKFNHGTTIDINPAQAPRQLGTEDLRDHAGSLRDEVSEHVENGSDFI
jgi:uncharacterized protein YdaU (DUF1376 family)